MATLKNTTIDDTGFLKLATGTTAQRPTGTTGMIRMNTSTGFAEYFNGSTWVVVAPPPQWSTAEGQILSGFTQRNETVTVTATGATSYAVSAGSLPPGMGLNTSNGTISGVPSGVADFSNTTFSFTILASNAFGGSAARAFSIRIFSRFEGRVCSTANEGQGIGVTAPGGKVLNRRNFSSYGTPNGSCGNFAIGGCHSGASGNWSPSLPATSVSTSATNGVWGDPCGGTPKRMYIDFAWGPF
jgi:hypothetical protein